MKHTVLRKIGSAFLITGLALALPAYAEKHGGADEMGMGEKGQPDGGQMAGMMRDMSHEMNEMSGTMSKGDMNPDAMKKMSNQMKQMGGMMENMSGMVGKGAMKDADKHKQTEQMEQMRKQMDQMRKDVPVAPAKK